MAEEKPLKSRAEQLKGKTKIKESTTKVHRPGYTKYGKPGSSARPNPGISSRPWTEGPELKSRAEQLKGKMKIKKSPVKTLDAGKSGRLSQFMKFAAKLAKKVK